MTSCCPLPRMPWNGATGAIARCKRVFIGCGHKSRSGPAWPWICGVKPTPKAGNKPLHHFILHGLDKPGSSATVSFEETFESREEAIEFGFAEGKKLIDGGQLSGPIN